MNKQELEDLYIRSLDEKLPATDEENFLRGLRDHPEWARSLAHHKKARELLLRRNQTSFGSAFASRLVNKIQNTGVVIDRQIFGLFKKFQLAAIGIVVALLILNIVFSEQGGWFGVDQSTAAPQEIEIPFDFSQTLNNL